MQTACDDLFDSAEKIREEFSKLTKEEQRELERKAIKEILLRFPNLLE